MRLYRSLLRGGRGSLLWLARCPPAAVAAAPRDPARNTKSASEAQSPLMRLPAVRERAAAAQYERGQERPVQRPVL
ncbi:hypothetical protein NDU88_002764 [Pleurodeles waltl]|uniref:Uncharacterized protein n=1 Tax=Pleurodeles waltl TaxID=8319 RepID=A0AAV7PEZ7_PLEWA|nr:hypothetical protein NDU88_002764 [Pleurodeles waltl]